ncbi:multidrug efflux protein NorA [compost metagenome]
MGVFRAVGNTTLPMILTLVSQWVIQFPLAYILSHNTSLGKVGIWWAFPISSVVTGLITLIIYAKGDWKKERLTGKTNKLIDKVEKEIVKEGFESVK